MVLYKQESGSFTLFCLLSQVVSGPIPNDSWVHTPVFLFYLILFYFNDYQTFTFMHLADTF